jgi:release factor glutamine methyltransferase
VTEPQLSEAPAIRMALALATAELRDAGCETPRLDAELLLAHALGTGRAVLHLRPERELSGEEAARLAHMLWRRRRREPVAYIVGTRAFRHIDLTVDSRVLVPRPETELLVEVALGLPRGARVADVGTGSGAVALALKHERPDLTIHATDASEDALAVASENAQRLKLDVHLAHGDLLTPLDAHPLDAILSNPPYIATSERDALAPEITDHEPEQALYAGPDGLDVLRRLIPVAATRAPFLALEIGAGQAPAVAELLRAEGMTEIKAHKDLAGHERVIVGRR